MESESVFTQQVIQLVGLIQLHKWRMLLLFQALDVDKSGEVDLFEFEWLWAFATVGGRLASKPLLQDEAELMLLDQEIYAATDDDSSNDNINAAFDLEALEEAHEKLQEHVDEELGKCHDDHMIILQLSSLANLAIAAGMADADWYGNSSLFKWLLALFPLVWATEGLYKLFYSPALDALQHPDKAVSQRASVLVLLFGVSGSVLMICDQEHDLTAANTQHALASATVFLFITRNLYFSRMVLAFIRVMVRCFPLVSAIFIFMLMFCQASKDIFGDKVASPEGEMYFDTNSHSLTTLFRLFTGAAWYEVMLRAAAATTEAALIWFLSYIVLVTMFCCELFVGVIISEFIEIHSIKSPRLFNALEPIFEFGPTEREAVLGGLLQLNRKMQPYNRAFFAVLSDGHSAFKKRQTPTSQLARPKRLHNSVSELFPAVLKELLATNDAEQTRVYDEYQTARLDQDSNDDNLQPHISQCVPVLMLTLGEDLVSITLSSGPLSGVDVDEMTRQHRKAVTQWLVGFIAAMCTEGIADHFNFVKHSDSDQKDRLLEHFQGFGSNHQVLNGVTEWSRVCNACHKAVDKIFDLYHGDSWLEPYDSLSADVCTKHLCSLLAFDELVRFGEVFYQQAISQASIELTEEEVLEARKWHRPFIWGMRMFQVMKSMRNTSVDQGVTSAIDEIMAAALASGIDMSDSVQLAKFTTNYVSRKADPIPAHAQFGQSVRTSNPLIEVAEIELHEMKTDETHELSSSQSEPPNFEMKTDATHALASSDFDAIDASVVEGEPVRCNADVEADLFEHIRNNTWMADADGEPELDLNRTYSALCADEAGVPIEVVKDILTKEGRDETDKPNVLSAAQEHVRMMLSSVNGEIEDWPAQEEVVSDEETINEQSENPGDALENCESTTEWRRKRLERNKNRQAPTSETYVDI